MEHIRYISVLIRVIRVYPLFGSGSAMLGSKMRITFFNSKIGKVKSEKGFTLVELIFVTVVTGILSSSLMLPLLNSMKEGTRPEIHSTATYCAAKELEELKSAGYSDIAANDLTSGQQTQVTLNGRTYYEDSVREYVSYSGGAFGTSTPATEYIRIRETVSNSKNSDVVTLWTILARDFYDPVANPP